MIVILVCKTTINNSMSFVPKYCLYRTHRRCVNVSCTNLHFIEDIRPLTDLSLGDCSYLDTCYRQSCRYMHYISPVWQSPVTLASAEPAFCMNADIRHLDFAELGKFSAVIVDPPWSIHMQLSCKFSSLADIRWHHDR